MLNIFYLVNIYMEMLKPLFLFILLQLLIINARNNCQTQFCGINSFQVRFPFQLEGDQPHQSCGHPGFSLDCNVPRNKVTLNIPNSGDFLVRNINYQKQEIKLYDPNGCLLQRLMNLNLSSSPFTAEYYQNYTFLRCPSNHTQSSVDTISCLSNSTASVLTTSLSDLDSAMNICRIIVTLPILVPGLFEHQGYSSDLCDDLALTWSFPDCVDCEEKGGIYGFENSTSTEIQCFSDLVKGKSRGLQILKIITLSLVVPAITCSLLISCFMCVMDRRRQGNTVTQNVATITPQSIAEVTGLDDTTIETYTKVVIGNSQRLQGPNGATCPICLVDYNPKETIRCIPQCDHCFHSECIVELKMNGTCPVCRNSPSLASHPTTSV